MGYTRLLAWEDTKMAFLFVKVQPGINKRIRYDPKDYDDYVLAVIHGLKLQELYRNYRNCKTCKVTGVSHR